MPKRNDIKSILIIGSGPIIIGQACEFDYSGTQACRALKEEGYHIILVNSNPATIMTDKHLAHSTYLGPVTPEAVTAIIKNIGSSSMNFPISLETTIGLSLLLDTVIEPTISPDTLLKLFIIIFAFTFFKIFKKNILVSLQSTLLITNLDFGVSSVSAIRKAAELGSEATL